MGDMGLLEVAKLYFAQVGIDMEIRKMETDDWIHDVKKGHKHDQISHRTGQGQLGQDMEPLRQLNPLLADYISNFSRIIDPAAGEFYYKCLKTNTIDEMKKVLRDANEYCARQHFLISLLHPMKYYAYQPWLKGYNGQFFSIATGTGGPALLYFYPARFWIDRKLKKSMRH
jgi:ABC-type transport system substrate-binding protein